MKVHFLSNKNVRGEAGCAFHKEVVQAVWHGVGGKPGADGHGAFQFPDETCGCLCRGRHLWVSSFLQAEPGRGGRVWFSSESGASSLALVAAVPTTPSPSLGTELSGHPSASPASPGGIQGVTSVTCTAQCHRRPPLSHQTPRQGLLSPGPCQDPGQRLSAPRLLQGVSPGTSTLPARQPEEEGGKTGAAQLWLA